MTGSIENLVQTYSAVLMRDEFLVRLQKGKLFRDENPSDHFCCCFPPYDLEQKKVLMVAHKKSGLWLFPGGHIEKDENPYDALTREIKEELGARNPLSADSKPGLLTITKVRHKNSQCQTHYDFWFFVPLKDYDCKINMDEFDDTRWVSTKDVKKMTVDESNLQALYRLESIFYDFQA